MNLLEQISNDLVTSMKENDKFSLSVLRMLKSNLQLEKINKKAELENNDVITVLKKQVKIRKDSIDEYTKYERMDLVENLIKEVTILSKYLPEELSDEEVEKVLNEIFEQVKPTSSKDMGAIMKIATEKLSSCADMKKVSQLVRQKLN